MKRRNGRQVPLSQTELRELSYSPDAIALALRTRRTADGFSQTELATQLRVTQGTVATWEHGGMPAVAARMLSYIYAEDGHTELWRARALLAETALRRTTEALADYRAGVRQELDERRMTGARGGSHAATEPA